MSWNSLPGERPWSHSIAQRLTLAESGSLEVEGLGKATLRKAPDGRLELLSAEPPDAEDALRKELSKLLDEGEALQRRYSAAPVVVLPLSSGHWAILNGRMQLAALADVLPSEDVLAEWSRKFEAHERVLRARINELAEAGRLAKGRITSASEGSADDLGV